ncbi:YqeG family HAD IIIA-type phosphatase [Heliorestis acidaminivorans]|uniref:YqeG family HAD IIIA-type phosphatase n=1 Tax=Heliorestis acidaminivorans TaxID=553427 RepID=A0A6I0EPV5_9FIRM|nr:YqeG family HAD IIIA-type phosphatase [Heliorestis acidaminivorans]KAB2951301.1 YqeG family HAD IIIA-type phosphatase [Heliorestis acidaminivorans]
MKLLRPIQHVNTVPEVDIAALTERGVKGVIIDLDNTLAEWNRNDLCPTIVQWLQELDQQGIKVCILSNNGERRVQQFAEGCQIKVPYISRAKKPRRKGFLQAMQKLGTTAQETAVIGDQIFTDVLGGNRIGMHTILVNPISRREFLGTRLVRTLEKIVLRRRRTLKLQKKSRKNKKDGGSAAR